MFEIPSIKNVKSAKVTKEVVVDKKPLKLKYLTQKEIDSKEEGGSISVVTENKENRA